MSSAELNRLGIRFERGEDFDPAAEEASLLVLVIDRATINEGSVGVVVDQLLKLCDTQAAVRSYADRLAVCFSGFDEDERWLCEMPAVVSFMRAVHAQWPYWLHFLKKDATVFDPVLSLLLDMRVDRSGASPRRSVQGGAAAVQTMTNMLYSVRALYMANGLGAEEGRKMEASVQRVMDAWFVP